MVAMKGHYPLVDNQIIMIVDSLIDLSLVVTYHHSMTMKLVLVVLVMIMMMVMVIESLDYQHIMTMMKVVWRKHEQHHNDDHWYSYHPNDYWGTYWMMMIHVRHMAKTMLLNQSRCHLIPDKYISKQTWPPDMFI
jgi:uncharacterized membrane-anchored protein YitT (DUF2179 family)